MRIIQRFQFLFLSVCVCARCSFALWPSATPLFASSLFSHLRPLSSILTYRSLSVCLWALLRASVLAPTRIEHIRNPNAHTHVHTHIHVHTLTLTLTHPGTYSKEIGGNYRVSYTKRVWHAAPTRTALVAVVVVVSVLVVKVGAGVEVRSASVVRRLSLKLTLARGLRGLCRLPPIALTTTIRFGCGRRSISLPLPLLFSFRLSLFPFSRSPLPSSLSFLFLLLNKFSVIYV